MRRLGMTTLNFLYTLDENKKNKINENISKITFKIGRPKIGEIKNTRISIKNNNASTVTKGNKIQGKL